MRGHNSLALTQLQSQCSQCAAHKGTRTDRSRCCDATTYNWAQKVRRVSYLRAKSDTKRLYNSAPTPQTNSLSRARVYVYLARRKQILLWARRRRRCAPDALETSARSAALALRSRLGRRRNQRVVFCWGACRRTRIRMVARRGRRRRHDEAGRVPTKRVAGKAASPATSHGARETSCRLAR